MDFSGQKEAEQLCLYIILAAGALAFGMGWFDASFALMMKVPTIHTVAWVYNLFDSHCSFIAANLD